MSKKNIKLVFKFPDIPRSGRSRKTIIQVDKLIKKKATTDPHKNANLSIILFLTKKNLKFRSVLENYLEDNRLISLVHL